MPRPLLSSVIASLGVLTASCAGTARDETAPTENVVTVKGVDYALIAPDTLPPGRTRFRFQSAGTVAHELAISRVREGLPLAQVLAAELRGEYAESNYDPGEGLLYADPGQPVEGELLVDLLPGRHYILICTLEAGDKVHAQLGMVKGVTVARSPGSARPPSQ